MEKDLKNYANLLITLGLDYQSGKIDSQHFVNMINLATENINKILPSTL